jgi:hypothetical protein
VPEETPPEGENTPPPGNNPEGSIEELPQWARDALTKANKEAAGYRAKVRELEPLAQKAKQLEDAGRSETEKLSERLSAAEQRAQEAELRALRTEVGAAKGLTLAQAKRLVGMTREELEADADELLATFATDDSGKPRKPKPTPGQGGTQGEPAGTPADQFASFLKSKL